MARTHKGSQLKYFPLEYVCVDVETTGLNPYVDRIIDVAAIHVISGFIDDTFTSLVQLPKNHSLSQEIQELTGITEEMLKTSPPADKVMPQFHQFISNYTIVGHNANFDVNFLYDACAKCGLLLENNYIDTLQIAREILPKMEHYRLSDLVAYFKIEQNTAHRAEADAIATAQCFEKMRRIGIKIENTDIYWREQMLLAVKRARKAGKHTWELTRKDRL